MSLVVTLRIPDGLVIAGDSLATMQAQLQIAAQFEADCPACKTHIQLNDVKAPAIPIPSSTRSFAQKVFSFRKKFAIGTTGLGALNNKTIYHHVKILEEDQDASFSGVTQVGDFLKDYFHSELGKQIKDIDKAPDNYFPLGFLVNGYDDDREGKTIKIDVGKLSKATPRVGMGCTISGESRVVGQLWALAKTDPRQQAGYGNFSLQDAIDYAEFLINTTANYQRFSNIIPTVGGDIDIALITPYKEFTWIRCKTLTRVLEGPGGVC